MRASNGHYPAEIQLVRDSSPMVAQVAAQLARTIEIFN